MSEKAKGIGLFGLIGMVVSSCIGSGVFAITGQLAGVASPGAVLVAWAVVGIGFAALALSLNNLGAKKPELKGIFQYAEEGFGPLAGFVSGWGYWLSAWLGNIAFATMMMSTLGYFFPTFLPGNTLPCVIVASLFMWALTFLVIRGVESASFLNAIVMVAKVASLGIFLIFAIFMFNAGIFTADFWGNVYNNAVAAGEMGADAASMGGLFEQVMNCMIIMMWVFIGIEGAAVMSSRARNKHEVGKATRHRPDLPAAHLRRLLRASLRLHELHRDCSARLPRNALRVRFHGSRLGRRVHQHRHHRRCCRRLAVLHHAAR